MTTTRLDETPADEEHNVTEIRSGFLTATEAAECRRALGIPAEVAA